MLNYVHIYYGYHYAQNYAAKAYPMVPFTGKFTLHYILRTFFTRAVDDVLPFSDFLSDDLLQYFDDYESNSSNAFHLPFLFQLLPLPLP